MSAELYGAQLLADIEEESLASLLAEVRVLTSPQGQLTGVIELDQLIESHRSFVLSHTHVQTTNIRSENLLLFSEDGFDQEPYKDDDDIRGPGRREGRNDSYGRRNIPVLINCIIEGPGSAAATRSLFNQLACVNVLSETFGGKSGFVVYIDCNSNFTARQLHKTIYSHIRRTRPLHPSEGTDLSTSSESASDVSKVALQHVHVIPCASTISLLEALIELPGYLLNRSLHHSFSRSFGLLIINGINAFHWQDRFDAEVTRLERLGTDLVEGASSASDEPLTSQIFTQLKALRLQFGCSIVYSSTSPPQSKFNQADSEEYSTFDPYSHNALFNIQPNRRAIPTFAPSMTIDDCLREQKTRQEAVTKASHTYYFAATPGGQGRKRQTQATNEKSGFTMRIFDDGGVTFENTSRST